MGKIIDKIKKYFRKDQKEIKLLTTGEIKAFKSRKESKILAGFGENLLVQVNENGLSKRLLKFLKSNPSSVFICEYDEVNDSIIKLSFVKKCDDAVFSLLSSNGGCVVFE